MVRIARPRDVVISALGVREGLLYTLLSEDDRKLDPLITAARELNLCDLFGVEVARQDAARDCGGPGPHVRGRGKNSSPVASLRLLRW